MKVKIIHCMCGKEIFNVGDTPNIEDSEAIRLVTAGIAEPVNKIDFNKAFEKVEAEKLKQAEDKAKANAIIRESHIQNELNSLYGQVALKEAELNGEVLSDEDLQNAIESISKRDAAGTKKAKGK